MLIVLALVSLCAGCFKDKITRSYTLMKPVFASKVSVLENIKSNKSIPLSRPGKIFILGRYIFVNELDKGVHVIDNIDPRSPSPVAFINIPGNIDIAVKGTTLFADMYGDLVVVDISDPLNAKFVKNVPDVFPARSYAAGMDDSAYMIVDWERKDTMVDVEITNSSWWSYGYLAVASGDVAGNKNSYVPGLAGSMARFSLVNDFLYTINNSALHAFDISNPKDPQLKSNTNVAWNIETLYPLNGKLFIGSTSGMFIYEISDPANPKATGTFEHAQACDPVIADDNVAFVTLRTGSRCNGTINQLDIIDVSNIYAPTLIRSYEMSNPAGLSKDGNILFICDGTDGLKVYDASNVHALNLISHIKDIETYDAIAWDKRLLVVANEGLFQYDYSDASSLKRLSVLHTSGK